MKKLLSLFAAAFMLLTAGCSQVADQPVHSGDDPIVLPPTRIGENTSKALLAKLYTFETAFSEAEAVARIKIGNWLSEDTENGITRFEASVLQCFKGDLPETFSLFQGGCSKHTIRGYPLFSYGNELLVFLRKDETQTDDYASYWIIGSYSTVLDITYDDDGNRYYADRYGFLGKSMKISPNYFYQNDILSEIYSYAINSDSFLAEIADKQHLYPFVFSETDVLELINSFDIS